MGRMETFQPAAPAAVSRVLATFNRDQLAGFIAVAIDLLDLADGDLDIEPNGDELDATAGEDDFFPHGTWRAEPGCPISDPDFGADDEGENRTWIETTDQRRIGDYALTCAAMDDDAEEDDASGTASPP